MREIPVRRCPEDRRAYELEGVGRITRVGWFRSRAQASELSGREWLFEPTSWWRPEAIASSQGQELGWVSRRPRRRQGAALVWEGRIFELRLPRFRRPEGVLLETDAPVLEARPGRGRPWPSTVLIDDLARLDPGVVLFAAWMIEMDAERRAAAAASAGV